MKIEQVRITNFRQYEGESILDLNTSKEKNIVLIGGLNGFGKTNLLISLVWCLYGENIAKADTRFRNRVQKSGNYPKFLKENLNFDAQKRGEKTYSIEIHFTEVNLPSSNNLQKCIIKRAVNIDTLEESLEVELPTYGEPEPDSHEEKVNFINDFLIPIDAAKFIFFNAEKISDMADLSVYEEGELLNDALSNILGLDVYEELINDFEIYIDQLKKSGSKGEIKSQIEISESEEKIKLKEIEEIEEKITTNNDQLSELKRQIKEYEDYIEFNSISANSNIDIGYLYDEKKQLEEQIVNYKSSLNDSIDIVPFALLSPLMEETLAQINDQESIENSNEGNLRIMFEEVIEKLFNKPDFPAESDDLTLKGKMFYSEKALSIISSLTDDEGPDKEIKIIHDLTQSDKDLLNDAYNFVRNNKQLELLKLSNLISESSERLSKIESKIKTFEADLDSEAIIEYREKKQFAEEGVEKINKQIGGFEKEKIDKEKELSLNKKQRKRLLEQINLSNLIKKKIELASVYLDVLTEFIVEEKNEKSEKIAEKILTDMQNLMHKSSNDREFISKVSVNPLPDNDGLNIVLYNNKGDKINKEFLSEGEKQLYISSVIKALIHEANQSFPIIIDTPLARLDQKHKNQVLKEYYPSLGEQVILMATDTEIPIQKMKIIEEHISKLYVLQNENNNTFIKEGYFGQ